MSTSNKRGIAEGEQTSQISMKYRNHTIRKIIKIVSKNKFSKDVSVPDSYKYCLNLHAKKIENKIYIKAAGSVCKYSDLFLKEITRIRTKILYAHTQYCKINNCYICADLIQIFKAYEQEE